MPHQNEHLVATRSILLLVLFVFIGSVHYNSVCNSVPVWSPCFERLLSLVPGCHAVDFISRLHLVFVSSDYSFTFDCQLCDVILIVT
jgi:hypothetical protein